MAAEVDGKVITWDGINLCIPNTETVDLYIASYTSHTKSDNSVIVLFGKNISHSGRQYTTSDIETITFTDWVLEAQDPKHHWALEAA